MGSSALVVLTLLQLALVDAVPIDWRTAQIISHNKNMGCFQSCGTNSTQGLAENSVTFKSALSPFTNVNPTHVVVLLAIAAFAASYQVMKLRKDTYRLLEENKQPTPDSQSQ